MNGACAPPNPLEVPVLSVVEPVPVRASQTDRFDDCFRLLYAEQYGLARSVLGDRAEAEDAVQEAFLKLVDAPVLARPNDEVAAWLRRVCLNISFNRIRSGKRHTERLERAGRADPELLHGGGDPSSFVLRREEVDTVQRALSMLPERQRNCLLLRHSGYSYAEVAASLDVALGSVGVILSRAESAFREIYQELDNEQPGNGLS
jgi:RNA polymerase sigma factor (sigma-70 family)